MGSTERVGTNLEARNVRRSDIRLVERRETDGALVGDLPFLPCYRRDGSDQFLGKTV